VALLTFAVLWCGPAAALVGADVADRTVQRYTVLVTSAKARCSGVVPIFVYRGMHSLVAVIVGGTDNKTMAVALSAHYGWIQETMENLSAP
jgi:coenzyme F420-reducing hydrogenase delta subunit